MSGPEEIHVTPVSEENISLALDVLESAFPTLSRTFFHSITVRDPAYNPEYSLAVQETDRYLSYLQVFKRSLRLGGEMVPFGGIGSVGTRPECRGQGLASALMDRAVQIFQRENWAGGLLFTSIHPFYEKMGWHIIRQNEQDLCLDSLSKESFRPDWIRALRENDFSHLHRIYLKMQKQMNGGIARTELYWQARASWLSHIPVIVIDENEIIGYFYYAQYDLNKPIMTVSEFGYVESDEWILQRMLRCIARKAAEIKCGTVRGFFRQDPLMNHFCQSHNLFSDERDFDYVMWKDVSSSPILDKLRNHAGRSGFLCWTTDAF